MVASRANRFENMEVVGSLFGGFGGRVGSESWEYPVVLPVDSSQIQEALVREESGSTRRRNQQSIYLLNESW